MSDTSRRIWIVIVSVSAAALFLAPACGRTTPPSVTVDTLDAWVELSQRPGFTLLDKKTLDDYFIAIYRTEAEELAYCYRWRGEGDAPDTSLAVSDDRKNNVKDAVRSEEATALNPTGSLPAGGFVHGMVVPIRQSHEGLIITVFRDNHGEPNAIPKREVYLRPVEWGK